MKSHYSLLNVGCSFKQQPIRDELERIFQHRWGAAWKWGASPLYADEYAWAMVEVAPFLRPGARVMDAGSGISGIAPYMAARGATVVAVDVVSPYPIKITGQEQYEYLHADLADTGLAPSSFDAIVSCSSIEHNPWEHIERLVCHLGTLLKPGAPLIFTVPAGCTEVWYDKGQWPAPFAHYPACYLWSYESVVRLVDHCPMFEPLEHPAHGYVSTWDYQFAQLPKHQPPYLSLAVALFRE